MPEACASGILLAGPSLHTFVTSHSFAVCYKTPPSEHAASDESVPIISFTADRLASSDIVHQVDAHNIGIRFGHFYSARLIEALGLPCDDGVVRVSMAHYNTLAEVDGLVDALGEILD